MAARGARSEAGAEQASEPAPVGLRADARANRERLLEAAVTAFAELGIDAEIREIAERAGLSVGALYRHFPSKEHLLEAVVEEALAEIERSLAQALAATHPVAGLRAFVCDAIRVMERYGEPLAALMEGRAPREQITVAFKQRGAALEGRMVELVERGVRDGTFRAELDASLAAASLRYLFMPYTCRELRRSRTPDQLAGAALDLFLLGAAGHTAGA